jgi:transposase
MASALSFPPSWSKSLSATRAILWVLPRRWIVERTFAWRAIFRRLNREHEINPWHSGAMLLK